MSDERGLDPLPWDIQGVLSTSHYSQHKEANQSAEYRRAAAKALPCAGCGGWVGIEKEPDTTLCRDCNETRLLMEAMERGIQERWVLATIRAEIQESHIKPPWRR